MGHGSCNLEHGWISNLSSEKADRASFSASYFFFCFLFLDAEWCPGPELNRYVPFRTRDFKSRASASFATRAGFNCSDFNSVRTLPKHFQPAFATTT